MSRWEVKEEKAEEGEELTNGGTPEVPSPSTIFKAEPASHWSEDDRHQRGRIGNDNTDMPPFVWEKL